MSSTKISMFQFSRMMGTRSVAFHPDGALLFSGSGDGVRRWRVADGQEVGTRMRAGFTTAISVSRDCKWIVCGSSQGASVWDATTHEKAIEVEGTEWVDTVDISPDSTRFATATGTGVSDKKASIWNILTGERLVDPLQHDGPVPGVRFSPDGERIATICPTENSLRVFDSHNGDQLVKIKSIGIPDTLFVATTPLAWSSNQDQIFVASGSNTIISFDLSTGSQLAEWQVHDVGNAVVSIALASNGNFLATSAWSCTGISFWDTTTLARIGPVIQDGQRIMSISLSLDCNHLATGGCGDNITIRNLGNILPDVYGPSLAPMQEDPEPEIPKDLGEHPSTLDIHDNKPPDSTPEQPTTSGQPASEIHHEDSNNDLLEVDLPSSTPAQLFDYSEPPSPASSAGPHKVHVTPPHPLQVIPQLAGPPSILFPPETCSPTKPLNTPGSSKGIGAWKVVSGEIQED